MKMCSEEAFWGKLEDMSRKSAQRAQHMSSSSPEKRKNNACSLGHKTPKPPWHPGRGIQRVQEKPASNTLIQSCAHWLHCLTNLLLHQDLLSASCTKIINISLFTNNTIFISFSINIFWKLYYNVQYFTLINTNVITSLFFNNNLQNIKAGKSIKIILIIKLNLIWVIRSRFCVTFPHLAATDVIPLRGHSHK